MKLRICEGCSKKRDPVSASVLCASAGCEQRLSGSDRRLHRRRCQGAKEPSSSHPAAEGGAARPWVTRQSLGLLAACRS